MKQQIKTHLKKNKNAYFVGGACLIVGIVGGAFLRSNENGQIVQKIYQIAWRPKNRQVVVQMIERSTPSKPVHLVGTNLYFNSLSEAARETGHSLSMISRNVNGHISDVQGDVFELLEPAA